MGCSFNCTIVELIFLIVEHQLPKLRVGEIGSISLQRKLPIVLQLQKVAHGYKRNKDMVFKFDKMQSLPVINSP